MKNALIVIFLNVSFIGFIKSQDEIVKDGYRIIYYKNGKISSE